MELKFQDKKYEFKGFIHPNSENRLSLIVGLNDVIVRILICASYSNISLSIDSFTNCVIVQQLKEYHDPRFEPVPAIEFVFMSLDYHPPTPIEYRDKDGMLKFGGWMS